MTPPEDAPQTVTKNFYALTPERVLAAVEVGGRRATGRVLALNSLENRVYEVELEDGPPIIAKFYRPGRWSREAILDEHAFLRELAEEDIPVAPPLAIDGVTLATSGDDGLLHALFEKVRGRAPDELMAHEGERLGRLVARVHHVGGRHAALHRPTLDVATYGAASVKLLVEGPWIPLELQSRFARVGEALVSACAKAFAAAPAETLRLHGDLHLGNLLRRGEEILVVDFDDFLAGPPVQDLWLLAPGVDAGALAARAAIVDGYEELRDFDRRTLRLVEPLRSLRILRYAAWIAQRWDDPAFTRAFPEFTEHAWWQHEIATLAEQLERIAAS